MLNTACKALATAWTRRQFLVGGLTSSCAFLSHDASAEGVDKPLSLKQIEAAIGGRLGVFALDTGSGKQLALRADERFAMCSTFKLALVTAVLERVDRTQWSLDERLPYNAADLLEYAPVTREHVTDGSMTVELLARAAMTVSDNTAANLLLAKLGGPDALTQFVRSLGDTVTRLDRNEPTLNANEPGDLRDTTSPRAMVQLMRHVLCDEVLSLASRERLLAWLYACETGKKRLRVGLPDQWLVGDKTGSGMRGAINDVAICFPPNRPPILIAAYMSETSADSQVLEAAYADIGRLVAGEFA